MDSAPDPKGSTQPDLADLKISNPPPAEHDLTNPTPYQFSTLALHADNLHTTNNPQHTDITAPLHLSTTFSYPSSPSQLLTLRERQALQQTQQQEQEQEHPLNQQHSEESHVYSRESNSNTSRLETILTTLVQGESIVYSSGLAALHALYIHLRPKRVAISGGYHGAHAVLALHQRLTGLQIITLESLSPEDPTTTSSPSPSPLSAGDVIHLETPLNPTGEARSISHFSSLARSSGAYLIVDSTFAPPPLQNPFLHGADIVMHSGTKYFGGHSDLLCGVLSVQRPEWAAQLKSDRTVLGSVIGNMEAWLCTRGLRTLSLRVLRASESAAKLVSWLESERLRKDSLVSLTVKRVSHASLQPPSSWLTQQMPHGFGAVFAITLYTREAARRFPSGLRLFRHATSLGGVESLVEWRAMSDKGVEEGLVRVSVGVEDWADLRGDLERGLGALMETS